MPTPKKSPTRTMSAGHKAAIAEGREQNRKIRAYLEALETNRPARGRRRTTATIEKRLTRIEEELSAADPLIRLHLLQERRDLNTELTSKADTQDISDLETAFIEVAAAYSERRGISYAAWREAGVSAVVLRAAGVSR